VFLIAVNFSLLYSYQPSALVVGTKEAAPFAVKTDQGNWTGISIELWQAIADELDIDYRLVEMDLDELIGGLEDGTLDASVSAITITAERESVIDFSHPYFASGLSIAVPVQGKGGLLHYVNRLFSLDLLKVLILLSFVLFVIGVVVWLFERKNNPEQFGGSAVQGIGAGFWWSAVTMTTVGYGDKAPATFAGRFIGLVWMFAGIIMISSFTAAITSELTVSQLGSSVGGPEDLPKVRVATVAGSTSELYLTDKRITSSTFNSVSECLNALKTGRTDAVVYDAPILRYLSNTEFKGDIAVLPSTFEQQYYGIALPPDSPIREKLNVALLEEISQPAWKSVLFTYLGD
jgi:ABC-type amino acid transport substrate-binding protein